MPPGCFEFGTAKGFSFSHVFHISSPSPPPPPPTSRLRAALQLRVTAANPPPFLLRVSPAAAAICKENMELVDAGLRKSDVKASISLRQESAERYLRTAPHADLIFIDPPYEFSDSEISKLLGQIPRASETLVVLERSNKSEKQEIPESYSRLREVSYGDTSVYFLTTGGAQ